VKDSGVVSHHMTSERTDIMRMAGKTAIITGAASGLGEATLGSVR
jgi:NADP-dependent 3-hydroxy acid dehydrogenase YdfG